MPGVGTPALSVHRAPQASASPSLRQQDVPSEELVGYLAIYFTCLIFCIFIFKKLDVLGMNLLVEKLIGCGIGKRFRGLCQA